MTKELKELEAAATKGPWALNAGANSHIFDLCLVAGTETIAFVHGEVLPIDDGDEGGCTLNPSHDARLIVAMRNALPDLLEAVEALKGARAALGFLVIGRPDDAETIGYDDKMQAIDTVLSRLEERS